MTINNKRVKVVDVVLIIILFFIIYMIVRGYKLNNFNDFVKAEYYAYQSEFARDSKVKYSDSYSYKISSVDYNDAMLYKEVEVTPNTPYKVTCMVKTENVQTKTMGADGGAQISISDTVEKSESITGTNDWQKLEFMFNSKNRTKVNIGFRLGGYEDNCIGTAWFSDFTIESGIKNEDSNWNFGCFVLKNLDVNIKENGKENKVTLSMTTEDISNISEDLERFKTSCKELSGNQMTLSYDMIEIEKPLSSLSYDDENGYYVAPKDVYDLISEYIQKKEYDHIFVVIRLGDIFHKHDIEVKDWIGLRRNGVFWNRIF